MGNTHAFGGKAAETFIREVRGYFCLHICALVRFASKRSKKNTNDDVLVDLLPALGP